MCAGPYDRLKLKTNPFAPELGAAEPKTRFDYTSGPLAPNLSEMHLKFYFDLYDWIDRQQFGGLDDSGRIQNFPMISGSQMTVIIISGLHGTGRTSLKNLLLYEIAKSSKKYPLVTEYQVAITGNKAQDALNFANLFVRNIQARPKTTKLTKTMFATIKNWNETRVPDEPNTEILFQYLSMDVKAVMSETPIVFSLDASNHMYTSDASRPACTMLRNLADYVILSLSDRDQAFFLKASLLINQIKAAVIDAPRISQLQARRLLVRRLADERASDISGDIEGELYPFTGDSLTALFAPAIGSGPSINLPISVTIQKLKLALERKITELATPVRSPGMAENRASGRITKEDMRRYLSL